MMKTKRKPVFRAWLDRHKWTVSEFVADVQRNGGYACHDTVSKWANGTNPRPSQLHALKEIYPDIEF